MDLFAEIETAVHDGLAALAAEGLLPAAPDTAAVTVEPPRKPEHGDMATNAAMVLAGPAGRPPREIAAALAARLEADPRVSHAEVAGPGFINLRLAADAWRAAVAAVLCAGTDFGRCDPGTGTAVNIEYVSANPTGPLHVGHARGAVVGDALAGLLDFAGCTVTREYYVNDAGAQVDTLARSVYLRYLEAHGREVAFADGHYPGDYLIPIGEALKREVGEAYIDAPESVWLAHLRAFATDRMMELIRADLAALGVRMDIYVSEKELTAAGRIERALEILDERGLLYRGVLEPPRGKTPEDWEPREQTLFRATAHGDDTDRPLAKSDGSWTYFASDIAYHADKIARGHDRLIDVVGADHGGYVKRIKAAVAALSDGTTPLEVKLCQLVKLSEAGEPLKMSKRAGTFVTLREVVDRVGADVARFVMLTRRPDVELDFDLAGVLEQSKDNPVFYVQYAHARVHSVLRKARPAGIAVDDAALAAADLDRLGDEAEIAVARKIAEWPRVVAIAARAGEPHRVAFYLHELAGAFHTLWNKGYDVPELRFIQDGDTATSQSKIALARAVGVVIAAGLGILGVAPVEEMR